MIQPKVQGRLFFLCLSLFFNSAQGQSVEAYKITTRMLEKCSSINTLYFEMTKTERIHKEYIIESFRTKLQYEPFYLYSRKIEVDKKPELLYRHGENENHAIVNPDGFPWFNLKLEPKGYFMRHNQHHTLYETGYKYALRILQHLFDKYKGEIPGMASKPLEQMINGRLCYVIEFNNTHFVYQDYTIKEKENILDIASRNLLSEYMILEMNKDVDDYNDVHVGQTIKCPNDYCPRLIIAIDKERMIPISLKIFDDKGLFEDYEYFNVRVNPSFKPEEFTITFPDYGF